MQRVGASSGSGRASRSRVELGFWIVAIGLHAGALGATRLFPDVNLLRIGERPGLSAVEVEMLDEPRSERERTPSGRERSPAANASPDGSPRSDRPAGLIGRQSRRADAAPTTDTPGVGEGGGERRRAGLPNEGPGDGDWSSPEAEPPPGMPRAGISDLARQIAIANQKAPAAPTQTPRAEKVSRGKADEVIKEQVRRQDKALGLDLPAAGTIAQLIRSAVQSSDTPATSTASFAVSLGPGGKVRSVKVVSSSSGDASSWNGVADVVKGALASQKLLLTEDYAKGAVVLVNVESRMKMPSGSDVDAGFKLSPKQEFDPADIGAKPIRRVRILSFSATPVK